MWVGPGYRIPLPNGRYTLTLHLQQTTVFPSRLDDRLVDIRCEGENVLLDFDPCAAGIAVVRRAPVDVVVRDGCLDLEFIFAKRMELAALEVTYLSPVPEER